MTAPEPSPPTVLTEDEREHCEFIGCVEHLADGTHVDSLGDAIYHVRCHLCAPVREPKRYRAPGAYVGGFGANECRFYEVVLASEMDAYLADRVAAAVQAERERAASAVEDYCLHPYVAEDGRKIWMGGFCVECGLLADSIRNGGQL